MSNYLKTVDSDWFDKRLAGTMFWIMAAFILLISRLFYLQVIEGKEFRRLSQYNCIRIQSVASSRGLIFDRSGQLLVDNRPSFDLNIILKDAKPVDQTLAKLAGYTGFPLAELKKNIKNFKRVPGYKATLLKSDIGRDMLAIVEAHKYDLPGVDVGVVPLRNYIHPQNASHLLGYLGQINPDELKSRAHAGYKSGDYLGKFGVEKTYENFLRGNGGGRQVEVNATGQVIRVLETVDPQAGNNLYLTIDQKLQELAEDLLKDKAGSVVAMDPTTGEILVMASSPSFDQNEFVSGLSHEKWKSLISNPFRPMANKAIQAEYPPASTYKIVTAMAGLMEGVIDENTTFHCPGFYKFGDRIFRCWKKAGHGKMNVVQALTESCDVFFYHVGEELGVDRLAQYAKACGLGKPTGIDLANESKGLIPTKAWKKSRIGEKWYKGETLSLAIGQGYNLVTPLQMLVLTAAVGNMGIRYKPIIIKKLVSAEGQIIFQQKPVQLGKLPASPEVLEIIRQGLWAVVNSKKGTAKRSRIAGIEMSGKTGTAQVVRRVKNGSADDQVADHHKDHAWFVAYAPSENPKIAVVVIVEHGEHGSSTAAPIAKRLIETFLSKGTESDV